MSAAGHAAGFGETFRLTLLTDDPGFAAEADRAGVDRVGLDFEHLGKAERQVGSGGRLSLHQWERLPEIAAALRHADLFARLNPLGSGTRAEVERALAAGVRALMLPFFTSAAEVAAFVGLVAGRARVVLLLETAAAALRIREIVAVPGIDEIMFGLNDLRLQFGVASHFEVLASPLLAGVAAEIRAAGLPLAVGGVARPDDASLPVPPDLVLAQYPRLGASGAWLSRSFFHGTPGGWRFADGLAALRSRLGEWSNASAADLEDARVRLADAARRIDRPAAHLHAV